ncbi:MAG: hypothetical protein Athens101410_606 [Parcubacteria group bacterium Athens1014_10]|nr:MAG: hypothetical protein Athens101410_606 [Parcubacteria group bacterium Athens1014_10]TSD06129.1 MAG: hypothetical protein Athens071412_103 [Parcubacteria group bacterium Athens0714_12]
MKRFRFLDWKIYKEAKELFKLILEIVKKLLVVNCGLLVTRGRVAQLVRARES